MLNEQQLEDLCIGWFQQTGWQFAHGPDMAPEGDRPERADFRQVVLRDRLLAALARIKSCCATRSRHGRATTWCRRRNTATACWRPCASTTTAPLKPRR